MADEQTNNNEGQRQETNNAGSAQEVDVRQTKAFRAVTKQLEEARAELAKITDAQKSAEAERERKDLEAKGQYDTITKQLQAQIDQMKNTHSAELLKRDLTAALIKAGATNDTFIRGAVAGFDGSAEQIGEYIETLKAVEENALIFGTQTAKGELPPANGKPGSRSGSNWAQTKADLNDPKKARAASQAVEAYLREHGTMPPGW